MLILFTILVMGAVAYAFLSEGLFTAITMFLNVMLAGLVTFNYFEPVANFLEDDVFSGALADYADFVALFALFAATMGLLRLITYRLSPSMIEFQGMIGSVGGVVVGLVTGYFLAGMFLCMLQTLPLHENFMDFSAKSEAGVRRFLPPDRVWLAMMCRAGAYAFAGEDDKDPAGSIDDTRIREHKTFDKYGTFELRYARYRRWNKNRDGMRYGNELNRFLYR
jgi:colicin V production protein